MITLIKIRLYILAIASAACFGFSGSAHGMQEGEGPCRDLKRYLICGPDKNCIKSFVAGHEFWNRGSEDNTGKHLWDIKPFALLHKSEKQKLLDSIKNACYEDKKVTCQLVVISRSQYFLVDVKINSVKCDDGSIGFFMRYSN
jgi:hypothetical protein